MYSRLLYLAFRNLFILFHGKDDDLATQMICRPSLGYLEIPQYAASILLQQPEDETPLDWKPRASINWLSVGEQAVRDLRSQYGIE